MLAVRGYIVALALVVLMQLMHLAANRTFILSIYIPPCNFSTLSKVSYYICLKINYLEKILLLILHQVKKIRFVSLQGSVIYGA